MKTCTLIKDQYDIAVKAVIKQNGTELVFPLYSRVRIRENCTTDEKLRKKYHVSGKVGRIIEFSTTNKGVTLFGLLLGRGDQFDHQYVRFEDIESLILE